MGKWIGAFLYGEWSVGQNDFDQAFYVCVRGIQKKAEQMGGDAVIWIRMVFHIFIYKCTEQLLSILTLKLIITD